MHKRITQHFLSIPNECPKSIIVFGKKWKKDFKAIARELYLKYVKEGAVYEINVDYRTRSELGTLMASNQWINDEEEIDPLKLYCIFDACLFQIHSLLIPAFNRFQNSNGFKLIQRSKTRVSVIQYMVCSTDDIDGDTKLMDVHVM